MLIAGFPSAATDTNCWVVAPAAGEQCVVIDPGIGVTGQLDEVIADNRLHPVAVLLTHGHFDHTFSVLPVCQARDVPAYIHPGDRAAAGRPVVGRRACRRARRCSAASPSPSPTTSSSSATATRSSLAGLDFAVTHAPGHSRGSVVFGLDAAPTTPVLFSGDVLFAGSIGRTDLPGGSMADDDRVAAATSSCRMDDATVVHPGHGPSTSIARERATNPFLQDL